MQEAEIGAGPYPRAARWMAMAILFVGATAIWVNLFHVSQTDFISYWAASVLALDGNPAAAWDWQAHAAVQAKLVQFEGLMPFPYPPPFLLLLLPFGLLPYPVAAALWIVATFAFYFAVARRVWPGSGALIAAFPAVLANAIVGQNGFLTAAIFILGLALLGRRPFLAGLVLGCLVIKPHLGLLLPVAFIAAGQWRAVAGAAASSLGLLLLGLIAFGIESYRAMFDLMPLYAPILSEGAQRLAQIGEPLCLAAAGRPFIDGGLGGAWRGRRNGRALCGAGLAQRLSARRQGRRAGGGDLPDQPLSLFLRQLDPGDTLLLAGRGGRRPAPAGGALVRPAGQPRPELGLQREYQPDAVAADRAADPDPAPARPAAVAVARGFFPIAAGSRSGGSLIR